MAEHEAIEVDYSVEELLDQMDPGWREADEKFPVYRFGGGQKVFVDGDGPYE